MQRRSARDIYRRIGYMPEYLSYVDVVPLAQNSPKVSESTFRLAAGATCNLLPCFSDPEKVVADEDKTVFIVVAGSMASSSSLVISVVESIPAALANYQTVQHLGTVSYWRDDKVFLHHIGLVCFTRSAPFDQCEPEFFETLRKGRVLLNTPFPAAPRAEGAVLDFQRHSFNIAASLVVERLEYEAGQLLLHLEAEETQRLVEKGFQDIRALDEQLVVLTAKVDEAEASLEEMFEYRCRLWSQEDLLSTQFMIDQKKDSRKAVLSELREQKDAFVREAEALRDEVENEKEALRRRRVLSTTPDSAWIFAMFESHQSRPEARTMFTPAVRSVLLQMNQNNGIATCANVADTLLNLGKQPNMRDKPSAIPFKIGS